MNGAFSLPLFLAFFAGMWIGVCYIVSRLSGWNGLAARFPGATAPDGESLSWTTARLDSVSFRSCLNMTLSPSGLFMVPSLAFSLFMPPLLLPWTDVEFVGFERAFFWRCPCFRLGGAEGPVLMLFRGAGDRFRSYLSDDGRRKYDSDVAFERLPLDRRLIMAAVGAALIGLGAAFAAHLATRR